jgi:hypothetical protein
MYCMMIGYVWSANKQGTRQFLLYFVWFINWLWDWTKYEVSDKTKTEFLFLTELLDNFLSIVQIYKNENTILFSNIKNIISLSFTGAVLSYHVLSCFVMYCSIQYWLLCKSNAPYNSRTSLCSKLKVNKTVAN